MFPLCIMTLTDEDQRAFMEKVYLNYYRDMRNIAMGVLHHLQDAEDVIQDTCIALCKKAPMLMDMECNTLRSYIVISIRHRAINLLRKRGVRPELLWGESEYLDSLTVPCASVEEDVFSSVEQSAVTGAIALLPCRERSLMEMKYILGNTDAEIGEKLGVKPVSVRVLLTRTRKKLLDVLEEVQHEDLL